MQLSLSPLHGQIFQLFYLISIHGWTNGSVNGPGVVSLMIFSRPILALTSYLGSYDAIELGKYTNLVKIYGEHARLCLNSLSLNLITANAEAGTRQNHAAASYLARACEAAINLVQHYCEPSGTEPIVRYGGDVSFCRLVFMCAR